MKRSTSRQAQTPPIDALVRVPRPVQRRLKMALLQEEGPQNMRAKIAELCDAYSIPVLKARGISVN